MKSFRFPLQRVLEWRQAQLELEESNYRRQMEIVAGLERHVAELEASEVAAERLVRAWNPVNGAELEALGSFRKHVKAQEREMQVPCAEARKRLAAQQQLMLEARRRVRLLEKLKERRLAEWRAAADKELEETASESFLARWNRGESGA
jgi:flagellar protein FliJ